MPLMPGAPTAARPSSSPTGASAAPIRWPAGDRTPSRRQRLQGLPPGRPQPRCWGSAPCSCRRTGIPSRCTPSPTCAGPSISASPPAGREGPARRLAEVAWTRRRESRPRRQPNVLPSATCTAIAATATTSAGFAAERRPLPAPLRVGGSPAIATTRGHPVKKPAPGSRPTP